MPGKDNNSIAMIEFLKEMRIMQDDGERKRKIRAEISPTLYNRYYMHRYQQKIKQPMYS